MKKLSEIKETILYGGISLLCCVFFLGWFVLRYADRDNEAEYEVVIFGDSIFGNCQDETSIAAILEEKLDKPVMNCAFGGTMMSCNRTIDDGDYVKKLLSMYSIAQTINTNDFGAINTVRNKENATNYFEANIDELNRIDFTKVKTIIIEQAINDYHNGVDLISEDMNDPYTFVGALRSSVELIKNKYPDVNIILVSPTYTWYYEEEISCEERVINGHILEDYVLWEQAIAEEYDLGFVDLYHNFFRTKELEYNRMYAYDGTHPTKLGRVKIAEAICKYMVKNNY